MTEQCEIYKIEGIIATVSLTPRVSIITSKALYPYPRGSLSLPPKLSTLTRRLSIITPRLYTLTPGVLYPYPQALYNYSKAFYSYPQGLSILTPKAFYPYPWGSLPWCCQYLHVVPISNIKILPPTIQGTIVMGRQIFVSCCCSK